jgi:hypothetical protein
MFIRHSNGKSFLGVIVFFDVKPGVFIALVISVVGNLVGIEGGKELSGRHEEQTVVDAHFVGVATDEAYVGDLGKASVSPYCVVGQRLLVGAIVSVDSAGVSDKDELNHV